MPNTCPHCGTALPPTAQRCNQCGAPIAAASTTSDPVTGASFFVSTSAPTSSSEQKRPTPTLPLKNNGCLLPFAIGWVLICILFLLLATRQSLNEFTEYSRLKSAGKTALATITQLEVESDDDSNAYYAYYQFNAEVNGDRARFNGMDHISAKTYRALTVGQTAAVVYWPSDPNVSVLQSEFKFPFTTPLIILCMLVPFTLIGAVFLQSAFKGTLQIRKLRARGQLVQGKISDRWQDKDSDGDPIYILAYTFRATLPGQRTEVITRAEQDQRLYQRYQKGQTVTIRYLPEDPQICEIVE